MATLRELEGKTVSLYEKWCKDGKKEDWDAWSISEKELAERIEKVEGARLAVCEASKAFRSVYIEMIAAMDASTFTASCEDFCRAERLWRAAVDDLLRIEGEEE